MFFYFAAKITNYHILAYKLSKKIDKIFKKDRVLPTAPSIFSTLCSSSRIKQANNTIASGSNKAACIPLLRYFRKDMSD